MNTAPTPNSPVRDVVRLHARVVGSTTRHPAMPSDDSDVAPVSPAPSIREVQLPAEATPGGVDNIPIEAVSANERAAEELDYGRLEQDTDAARQ